MVVLHEGQHLRSWPSKWRGAPFPATCGPASRKSKRTCRTGDAARRPQPRRKPEHSRHGDSGSTAKRPIIIIKKKGGHGGHHGGAWKVAYADFVTAMMALFIVLWLMNSSKQIQEAVGGYFKDPTGTSKKVGSNMIGSGENFTLTKDNMPEAEGAAAESRSAKSPNFEKLKNHIEMTVTSEGLRIELPNPPSALSSIAAARKSAAMVAT